MLGKVIKLFITKDNENKTRNSMESITLDEMGIQNDKFYGKNSMRSILLTSMDSYKISADNAIKLEYGSLGENILIDINPYKLLAGDKLKIGEAELEITQNCTLCKGLSTINSKLPKLLQNDRGIFAKVINGNYQIKIGDKVEIYHY